jgi:hypothetical protein
MQIAVGISLQSCIEAEIQVHPVLAAAIFNLSFPVSKYGLRSLSDGAIKFSDPKTYNRSVKCIFNLTEDELRLSYVKTLGTNKFPVLRPPYWITGNS